MLISAKIPFITGNVNDEGTIFVKPQTLETSADVLSFLERDYLNRGASFFKNLTSIIKLEILYPNIPALGSPFGTGSTTFFGQQFKRAAAIYGGKLNICLHTLCYNFLCWSRYPFPIRQT
jgi:acetylcholinesterase